MYVNLHDMLRRAQEGHYAVGAFNIVNELTAASAVKGAQELCSPIILQTSVSTVRQIGAAYLIRMLKNLADDAPVPVAVHLDHCTDPKLVRECIGLGWSSVMIDLSKEPFEHNIAVTKEIVKTADLRHASVEAELGAIAGVEDEIQVEDGHALLATPEASKQFVEATGVDAFAPAIGTAHGLYKGVPKVEFDLFRAIRERVSCAVVVHGGTGLSEEVFRKLVLLGAAKINISTAVKIAYCQGMLEYGKAAPEENDPLRLDRFVSNRVKECVKAHIAIFGSENKA